MNLPTRLSIFFLVTSIALSACTATGPSNSSSKSPLATITSSSSVACPATEPVWVKPPEDSAVQGSPGYGYYFVNEDLSIWASAWWTGQEENYLLPGEGIKVGWFRPEGATLEITGRRLDAKSAPLEAHVPCCYPTRFQATGLYFPTEGCWEVTAKAADSLLSFVVRVEL